MPINLGIKTLFYSIHCSLYHINSTEPSPLTIFFHSYCTFSWNLEDFTCNSNILFDSISAQNIYNESSFFKVEPTSDIMELRSTIESSENIFKKVLKLKMVKRYEIS